MTTTRRAFLASLAGAGIVSAGAVVYRVTAQDGGHGGHRGWSTPEASTCHVPLATPGAGTPMAMMDFDLAYIDMMIPHHESIIALAETAVDRLEDERLVQIAQAILDTQPAEIEELRVLREQWYGSPDPHMMSDDIMNVAMGGHASCDANAHMDQMSGEWQVQQFEKAHNKDFAFIKQVIAHHQMAVDTSRVALDEATHPEIRDISARVIEQQEAEIAALKEIREDLPTL